jgi:hypothetical protein
MIISAFKFTFSFFLATSQTKSFQDSQMPGLMASSQILKSSSPILEAFNQIQKVLKAR